MLQRVNSSVLAINDASGLRASRLGFLNDISLAVKALTLVGECSAGMKKQLENCIVALEKE